MLLLESPLIKKEESITFYTKLGFDVSYEGGVYLAKEKRFGIVLNPDKDSSVALRIYGRKKTTSIMSPSGVLIHLFSQ